MYNLTSFLFHSLKQLLSTYYMPGILPGTRNMALTKTATIPTSEPYNLVAQEKASISRLL